MYASDLILNDTIRHAQATVDELFKVYRPFIIEGDKFVSERELIYGENEAILLILKQAPLYSDYTRTIYASRDVFEIASSLADRLCVLDSPIAKFTTVKTQIPYMHIMIYVDGLLLYNIKRLPRYKGFSPAEALRPIPVSSLRSPDISVLCFGPELLLLDIYRQLCNPDNVSDWGNLIKKEHPLRVKLLTDMKDLRILKSEKIERATHTQVITNVGTDDINDDIADDITDDIADDITRAVVKRPFKQTRVDKDTQDVINSFRDWILDTEDHIVVGSATIRSSGDRRCQIVTERSIRDVSHNITNEAHKLGIIPITTINELMIPGNDNIKRLTVNVRYKDSELIHICDIFNLCEYTIVPIVYRPTSSKSLHSKRGTIPLIMYLRISDMWTIILLHRMKKINDVVLRLILQSIYDDIKVAGDVIDKIIASGLYSDILPISGDRYMGRWINTSIQEKRNRYDMISSQEKRYFDYIPILRKSS